MNENPRLVLHRGSLSEAGALGVEGSSALALPVEAAEPLQLHSIGSAAEQKWVAQLAGRITSAAIEVLAGRRPVQQLARWLDRDVLATLQLRARLSRAEGAGRSGKLALVHRGASLVSSRAMMVQPGIYEASAVVSDRVRCRAVALRLEQVRDSGWRVTALEIG
ncbi:Rv3235 family protein [Sinomonas gamaensis]|uniref:Rv3235 family protein n=1 Tax=Sinomonas gamaensis TaxID=2565624 RepID=UPI0020169652|nr:Rv3235 family protein [Sinomonas gamaensis]